VIDAILTRGELSHEEIPELPGINECQAKQLVSVLSEHGVIVSMRNNMMLIGQ
jgi:transcription initiation factor IIE alpha subunit